LPKIVEFSLLHMRTVKHQLQDICAFIGSGRYFKVLNQKSTTGAEIKMQKALRGGVSPSPSD